MSTTPAAMDSARTAPNLWRFANIEFDERSFELRVGGVSVDVERAPLRVLRELLETPRELVSREALLASVWKRKPETISRNALTNAIGKLRRAIGDEDQTLVVSSSGEGYRLEAEVERRALPPLQSLNQILKRGEPAPLRPNWVMRERIGSTDSSEVWIVEHPKTHERRVFKFAGDGFQLAALRREITISRLLREALGPRPEFVRIHDWNLEQPPYFIESDHGGADLGEWAAQQPGLDQRPLAERLRVIAELADAVALAHSVGALHKDLKPGNVLIDPEGRVRVVDFGSGRVLEPELLDQFQITRIALPEADPNTGTPFYIAPELLSGQAPTVASDVYSIGVLLYQFIVGDLQRPIAPGWESEIDDVLLREDIALAASGKPALRPTAAELASRLRTLQARHQQRDAALAEQARTTELRARLSFAEQRRRSLRWAVIALVLGMAATLTLYFKLLHAEQQREVALLRADEESANSRQITRYVLSLFDTADPEKNGGRPIAPRQLVDYGREQLDRQSEGRPAMRARMMAALADLYCKLGDAEACGQQIEAALSVQRAAGIHAAPEVTALFLQIASHADELQSRDDDAERNLRGALALIDNKPGTDPVLLAQVLQELGTTLQRQDRNAEALTALQRARALQRSADGADTLAGVKTLMALSLTELDMGQSDAALALAQDIVKITQAQAGENDLRYFDALMNQANVVMAKLRYADAETLMRQALAGYIKIYGRDARRVFETKSALVDLLNRQGRLRESTALATEVADGMRPKAGADDPNFAVALNDVGVMRLRYGDYVGALPWLRQAFEIVDHHFGSSSVQTIRIRHNLGMTLVRAGKPQEGLALLQTDIPASLSGIDIDYTRGRRLLLIGEAQSEMGEFEQARASFDQAEAQFKRIGDVGYDVMSSLGNMRGHSLAVSGRYAEALSLLEDTATAYRKLFSAANDPSLLDVEVSIASCELHLGHPAEARKRLDEVGPLVETALAPTHRAYLLLQRLRSELKTTH